jgi:hypothetical protein
MPDPTVQVVGVHPIDVTPSLMAESLSLKFAALDLSETAQVAAEAHVRAELQNAALIEVVIFGRDARFRVDDFGQAGSDQAPYHEVFLAADGLSLVAEGYDVPAGPELRVAFFLHFLNRNAPLRTSYGDVPLPQPTPMPGRLAKFAPYEPVT